MINRVIAVFVSVQNKNTSTGLFISPYPCKGKEDHITCLYHNSAQLSDSKPKGLRNSHHLVTQGKCFYLALSYFFCSLD